MNPTIILIVSFVGLAGFGLLLFVALRWMREEKGGQDEYKFGVSPAAAPPAPPPPGTHEVLRVLRDDLTGRVSVEIAGQRYQRVMEITDPNVGRGFVTTVRDLQKFLQGQATGSAPETVPAPAAPPPPQAETSAPPAGPAAPAASPQPSVAPAAAPLELPSMNPFKQMKVLRELQKKAPPEPKTIPEQIDEVLQTKAAGTPFARRGLKVTTGPSGSVAFQLDGRAYEGVDAVPDPEAQAVIRAAVKEWESGQ